MDPSCPYVYPLRLLSRKWAYMILRVLPGTFSEIKDGLHFITNRSLSLELQTLQDEGIVRKDGGTYSLSSAGEGLLLALEPLKEWGVKHKQGSPCNPEKECLACSNYAKVLGFRKYTVNGVID